MAADDAIGPTASRARGRLEAIRVRLVAEMTRLLRRLSTAEGKLASDEAALDNARRIRSAVLALLREDGLPVVIGAGEAAIADAVEVALGAARRDMTHVSPSLSVSFDAEAKDAIERSVSGVLDEIAEVFQGAADMVRKSIDAGLNTSVPLDDLIADVAAELDTSFGKASTAVETAVRMAMQKTTMDQGERAAEASGAEVVWLYDGASDSKVRPFCRSILGKAFTREAIDSLDNGTDLPVDSGRGGYGCRHRWSMLLRAEADERGIKVID